MNPYLSILMEKLQKWGRDTSSICESDQLFFNIPVHKDDVYESLFEDCDPELDTLTQMALELLSHSILLILDRLAKDQLPTGKYADPSPELIEQTKSVPKTNTVSERDFGFLDLLLKMKPAVSTVCFETIIMWSKNKTSDWSNKLAPDEKKILDRARQMAPGMKKKHLMKEKYRLKDTNLKS